MIFNRIFYQKIRISAIMIFCLMLAGQSLAQDDSGQGGSEVNVTLRIVDTNGEPLANSEIILGEDSVSGASDNAGEYTIIAESNDIVSITRTGYQTEMISVSELLDNNVVTLQKSSLLFGANENEIIPMPFVGLKKKYLSGSYSIIKGEQLERYPSTDLRNAFSGLANGVNVRENHGEPGVNVREKYDGDARVSVFSRGQGMVYVIDGMPSSLSELQLNPEEIESATIIKDIVGKSMFGPYGANGIVLIETKRGNDDGRVMKVNLERGVNVIDRFPEMVSGADYARLNNIARSNSGLDPLYSEDDIQAFAKNDPYDMYHPSVNYRDLMLKNTSSFTRANVSSRGGNEAVKYFAYLGYNGEGDIYKIGPESNFNRINARSNLDIKVTDYLDVKFDFVGGLTLRNSSNYGYDDNFSEFPDVISDINSTPPVAFPVYADNDPELTKPWYAVSSSYGENPVGNLVHKGYYTETGRSGAFNTVIDFDLSGLLDGLKSSTFIGLNGTNFTRIGKDNEDYAAYIVDPGLNDAGEDTIRLTRVHDGADQSGQSKLDDFYYQHYGLHQTFKFSKDLGNDYLNTSASFFASKNTISAYKEPRRLVSGVFRALYSINDKYNFQGVLNYSGSSSFAEDNRYLLTPAGGFSWIVSEEGFLENSSVVDYLKLRAEAGVMGYEGFESPFNYRDNWASGWAGGFGAFSTNQWFGSNTETTMKRTYPGRIGNPDLSWEKRVEYNAGFELSMFGNKLYIESNYYNQLRDGMITSLTNRIPLLSGLRSSASPMFNYSEVRYTGVETAMQYSNYDHALKFSFGGNATWQESVIEAYNSTDQRYDYQNRVGTPMGAIFGLTYLGKFQNDEETLVVPQLFDEELHAGDLKYKDMNNDGVVDSNDESQIGNSTPKLFYSINARFEYRNLELNIIGTGYAFYDVLRDNSYFHGGSGTDNYSNYVLENHGGAYPTLTYYRVNNNFQSSSYWLSEGGFFKIKNVEIAWNIPGVKSKKWGVSGVRLYARGANLYTFSKIDDIDPESKNSGIDSYPLFRTFTGGMKLTF